MPSYYFIKKARNLYPIHALVFFQAVIYQRVIGVFCLLFYTECIGAHPILTTNIYNGCARISINRITFLVFYAKKRIGNYGIYTQNRHI